MTETWSREDGKHGATTPEPHPNDVSGWGVFRPHPWDLAGIFKSREDAERERDRAGDDYRIAFGTAHVGVNFFHPADPQPQD